MGELESDDPDGERSDSSKEKTGLGSDPLDEAGKLRLEMNDPVEVKSPRRCWRMSSSAKDSSVVITETQRERERGNLE